MKSLIKNNNASAIPIILFVLTVVGCGALYSLLFLEIGFGLLDLIPVANSDSKTFIMMCLYAVPLFVIVVGVAALIKAGLKRGYIPQ